MAVSLNHPNVVQMYDAGSEAGLYYMAMEYLHGEDVRSLLRALEAVEKKLPLEHALSIAIGLSAGLHHAHEAVGMDGKPLRIVHRDISPHDVFVTFDGAVKVVDFGIAKSRNRKTETRAGTRKGNVPYVSPEPLRGDGSLDRRSDVYAIGVMLYEITLGQRPHVTSGQGEFALMMAIARGDIRPPAALDPAYPKPLEKIVLEALARDPEQRYQSARERLARVITCASGFLDVACEDDPATLRKSLAADPFLLACDASDVELALEWASSRYPSMRVLLSPRSSTCR